jgi:hypothetical protein
VYDVHAHTRVVWWLDAGTLAAMVRTRVCTRQVLVAFGFGFFSVLTSCLPVLAELDEFRAMMRKLASDVKASNRKKRTTESATLNWLLTYTGIDTLEFAMLLITIFLKGSGCTCVCLRRWSQATASQAASHCAHEHRGQPAPAQAGG